MEYSKAFGHSYEHHLLKKLIMCEDLRAKTVNITFNRIVTAYKTSDLRVYTGRPEHDAESRRRLLAERASSDLVYVLPKQTSLYLKRFFESVTPPKSHPLSCFDRLVGWLLRVIYTNQLCFFVERVIKNSLKENNHLFFLEENAMMASAGQLIVKMNLNSKTSSSVNSTFGSSIISTSTI